MANQQDNAGLQQIAQIYDGLRTRILALKEPAAKADHIDNQGISCGVKYAAHGLCITVQLLGFFIAALSWEASIFFWIGWAFALAGATLSFIAYTLLPRQRYLLRGGHLEDTVNRLAFKYDTAVKLVLVTPSTLHSDVYTFNEIQDAGGEVHSLERHIMCILDTEALQTKGESAV